MKYDFAAIEKKWQDKWEQEKPYAAVTGDPRPKFYGLIEFPYPSAAGLHVGHPRPFTAMDIICRKKRMQGYNVLFPIGYDAFGLPTENFAIKNHIHPAKVTHDNIENFRKVISRAQIRRGTFDGRLRCHLARQVIVEQDILHVVRLYDVARHTWRTSYEQHAA